MVFLALPALQRAQRDTQRKEDISRLMTAVTHYEANNRGAIPNFTGTATPEINWVEPKTVDGETGVPCDVTTNGGPKFPNSFCGRYLIVQGANDQFADPDGTPYIIKPANDFPDDNAASTWDADEIEGTSGNALMISTVGGQDGITISNTCKEDCAPTVSAGTVDSTGHGGYSAYGYVIHVVYSATCNGEVAIKSSGARKFAVLYKLEGGGVMCQSN
jgi:hypothetical protein